MPRPRSTPSPRLGGGASRLQSSPHLDPRGARLFSSTVPIRDYEPSSDIHPEDLYRCQELSADPRRYYRVIIRAKIRNPSIE